MPIRLPFGASLTWVQDEQVKTENELIVQELNSLLRGSFSSSPTVYTALRKEGIHRNYFPRESLSAESLYSWLPYNHYDTKAIFDHYHMNKSVLHASQWYSLLMDISLNTTTALLDGNIHVQMIQDRESSLGLCNSPWHHSRLNLTGAQTSGYCHVIDTSGSQASIVQRSLKDARHLTFSVTTSVALDSSTNSVFMLESLPEKGYVLLLQTLQYNIVHSNYGQESQDSGWKPASALESFVYSNESSYLSFSVKIPKDYVTSNNGTSKRATLLVRYNALRTFTKSFHSPTDGSFGTIIPPALLCVQQVNQSR